MQIDNLSVGLKVNGADNAVQRIMDMAKAVESLARGVSAIDAGRLESFANGLKAVKGSAPTEKQATNMTAFAAAITEFTNAISGANITQVATDMSNLSSAVQGMGARSVRTLTNATSAMQNFAQQTRQAVQNANVAPNRGGNNQPQANTDSLVNSFREVNKELSKVNVASNSIKGALAKMGTFVPTNKFKALSEQAEKLRTQYNELRDSMSRAMQSGELTGDSKEFEKKQKDLARLRNEYDRLIQKQKELAQEGGAFQANPNFAKAYQGIGQVVGGVKQAFSGVGNTVKTVNGYINTFISKLRGLGSASKKAKTDSVSLKDTIKKLGSEITRVSKMMKLMITRMALRAVIKEVGNGFQSLALHSEQFNQSMSNLINSSKTLGYSFAGMVSPLINALAPALVYIIELLTKAINLINQLFSALSGASTWNKAKSFTDSWADSIKEAAGKAKELKKTVLGFDELNQLQDKTKGGSGTGITDMFETMPIDSWAKDLAKKIKDIANTLFEPLKEAWRKVGEFVINSWKYAMREVGKLVKDMARDFLKVWEQADTQKIFEAILETVGWIGIAVGNIAKQLREAWNYNETGLHILENIRDIILIIVTHIRDMARATAEWAGTLDFKPLLTAVNEFLASLKPVFETIMGVIEDFYNEVVLKFTKWVIESGLPELINVFTRFNQEVDWEGLRSKLAELWKHLEPFMETVGEGLIIFIERVTTKLKDFINGDKFAEFLEKLEKWMDSVTPEDVADGIEKLVGALVAFKMASVAISALSGAAAVISAIMGAFKGVSAIASGVSTFASAIGGLGGALLPIIAIAAAVAGAIYSLISSYGGLEEVATKVKDTIGKVTEKLGEYAEKLGISDKIQDLKDAFDDLFLQLGNMKGVWDAFFFILQKVAQFIGTYFMPILGDLIDIASSFVGFFTGIIQTIGGLFDVLVGFFTGDSERVSQGAHNMWEGIKKAFENGVKWVGSVISGLADLIIAPFRTAKEMLVGDPIVIDMWDDIKEVFSKSIGEVVKFVTGLKDDIIKLFTDLKSKVDEKINDIKGKFSEWASDAKQKKDDIARSLEDLKSKASTHLDNTKQKISTFASDWSSKFNTMKSNLGTFVSDASSKFGSLKDNVVKAFESIKTAIKQPINDALGYVEKLVNGIVDGFNSLGDKLGSLDIDVPDWVTEKTGIGDFSFSLPKLQKISIPRLKNGGMLEDGMFFTANHNELIGGFDNGKTAVANNTMIVEGIQNGVYNAVMSALSQQGGSERYISNEIYIDGEKIASSVTKAQEKQNRRYSPSMA